MNLFYSFLLSLMIPFSEVSTSKLTDCIQYNAGKEPIPKIMYSLEKMNKTGNILNLVYADDKREYQVSYIFGQVAKDVFLFAKKGDIVKYDYYNENPVLLIIRKDEVSIDVRYFYLCFTK